MGLFSGVYVFVLCERSFPECSTISFKDLLVASPVLEINGWITKHLYIFICIPVTVEWSRHSVQWALPSGMARGGFISVKKKNLQEQISRLVLHVIIYSLTALLVAKYVHILYLFYFWLYFNLCIYTSI